MSRDGMAQTAFLRTSLLYIAHARIAPKTPANTPSMFKLALTVAASEVSEAVGCVCVAVLVSIYHKGLVLLRTELQTAHTAIRGRIATATGGGESRSIHTCAWTGATWVTPVARRS